MSGFKFREKLLGVASLRLPRLLKALADSFAGIGAGGDIEQSLVSGCVLYDRLSLTLDRQHYGSLAFLELFHEVAGATSKSR
jgi:hypothetical protein